MHIVDALSLALECLEDSPYSIEATEEELLNEVPETAYSIALEEFQNNVEKIDALIENTLWDGS